MIPWQVYTLGEILIVGIRPGSWFLNKKKMLINEKERKNTSVNLYTNKSPCAVHSIYLVILFHNLN